MKDKSSTECARKYLTNEIKSAAKRTNVLHSI